MNCDAAKRALLLELKRSRHRLGLARHSLAAGSPPTDPVFVVCAGRTGSQLLTEYLNCLPGVTMLDEVLNEGKVVGLPKRLTSRAMAERHLRHCTNALPGPVRGAKLLFSQLENHGLTLDRLEELFPEVSFVVLYRRSLADQYLSLRMADETGVHASRSHDDWPSVRLHIERADLEQFYERVKGRYRRALDSPSVRARSAIICYEDLTADAQRVFHETLCPFLGVPTAALTTTLVKQNRRRMEEIVENYEEVRDLLSGDISHHEYC